MKKKGAIQLITNCYQLKLKRQTLYGWTDVKGRKYIKTPAKYYYSDVGLRNARLGITSYIMMKTNKSQLDEKIMHR